MRVRLNKHIADAGVASRRQADRLIEQGFVRVNGQVVDTLGYVIDDENDRVEVRGKIIAAENRRETIMLNKPAGYLVTTRDPAGRRTIMELIPSTGIRFFPVGRLDYESEGLLLLTNVGELAHRLMHPRYEICRTYRVWIKGRAEASRLDVLRRGVYLDNRRTAPAKISVLRSRGGRALLEAEIHEGRNREIRRMFAAVGYPVTALKRIRYAGISLGKLRPGEWRRLRPFELEKLYRRTGLEQNPGP